MLTAKRPAARQVKPHPQSGFRKRLGIALFRVTRAILILIAVGMLYQHLATIVDRYRYPAPGTLVDVGGYRMHIICAGTDSPTVVMDAGGGESSLTWSFVQPEVAKTTRVCTYDRAGLGWSDPGPYPRTSQQIARELHTLLHNAAVPGPYVLVGHSFGGYTIRSYANQYPSEVAGMVFVDSSHEELNIEAPQYRAISTPPSIVFSVGRLLVQSGVARVISPFFPSENDKLPAAVQGAANSFQYNMTSVDTSIAEIVDRDASEAQLRANQPSLGNIPVVVLIHDPDYFIPSGIGESMGEIFKQIEPTFRKLQEELAQRSLNGSLIMAQGCGHYIQLDKPQVVIDAIAHVVNDVRQ